MPAVRGRVRLPRHGAGGRGRASAGTGVHVATVATAFPSGRAAARRASWPTSRDAVDDGADEIDMVIDRGAFLAGRFGQVFDEIRAVKAACGPAHLKVILETGELAHLDNVRRASWLGAAGRRRLHQDVHRQGRRPPRRCPSPW